MRRSFSALLIMGAIFLISNESRGDIVISSAPLLTDTTAQAAVVEVYSHPIASKKPKIVSGFGKRDIPPVLAGNLAVKVEKHEGVDYAVPVGTVVRSAHSGKVIFAGFSKAYVNRTDRSDQHRFLIVQHPDGSSCRYVHMSGLKVKPGQEVKSGQSLGLVSESAEWSEPILHFEIRNAKGQPVDPQKLIKDVDRS